MCICAFMCLCECLSWDQGTATVGILLAHLCMTQFLLPKDLGVWPMAQGSAGLNLGTFSLPPQKDARAHEKQALSFTHPCTCEGPRPIVHFAVDEHGGSILGDPVHFHRHGEAGLNGRFCRGKARVSSATCLWVTAQLTQGQFTQTHIWLLSFPAQTLLKT